MMYIILITQGYLISFHDKNDIQHGPFDNLYFSTRSKGNYPRRNIRLQTNHITICLPEAECTSEYICLLEPSMEWMCKKKAHCHGPVAKRHH